MAKSIYSVCLLISKCRAPSLAITMSFYSDVHGPQRIKPVDFSLYFLILMLLSCNEPATYLNGVISSLHYDKTVPLTSESPLACFWIVRGRIPRGNPQCNYQVIFTSMHSLWRINVSQEVILTLILSLYLDNIIPGFILRGLDNPPVFSSIPTLRFTLIFAPTVAATSMIPQMFHDVRLSIRPALCTEPHACHINDVPISLRLGTPHYLLVSEHFLVRSNTGMMTSRHLGFPRQSLVCFFSFVK